MSNWKRLPVGAALFGMALAVSSISIHAQDEVTIAVQIDPEADFRLLFYQGDKQIFPDPNQYIPQMQRRDGHNVRIVTVPLELVADADRYCVWLANGWIVHDQQGKAYSVSCDSFDPADWAGKYAGPIYSMDVQPGAPD